MSGLGHGTNNSTTHSKIEEKWPVRNRDGILDLLCPWGIQVKISNRLLFCESEPQHKI